MFRIEVESALLEVKVARRNMNELVGRHPCLSNADQQPHGKNRDQRKCEYPHHSAAYKANRIRQIRAPEAVIVAPAVKLGGLYANRTRCFPASGSNTARKR